MNQLIVIMIILRNLLKPFVSSVFRLSLCICALCISLYVYQIYNDVPKQNIIVNFTTDGAASNHSGCALSLDFNYTEDRPDTVPSIKLKSYTILHKEHGVVNQTDLCENIFINDFNDSIRTNFDSADFFATVGIVTDYEDNDWLFPHPVDPIRKVQSTPNILEADSIILPNFVDISYSKKMDIGTRRNKILGYDFGKDKSYWALQNILAVKWKDLDNDTAKYYHYEGNVSCYEDFYSPKWYSAFDVSKIKTSLHFNNCDSLSMVVISYGNRISTINDIIPEPDEKTIYGLIYTSPDKLKQIKKRGLHIFATFPEYESLQQTRNYVLSALITLFLTLTATFGWNFLCKQYKQTVRLKRARKNALKSHCSIYIKLTNYLLFVNIFVTITILAIIYLINPYQWLIGEFIAILIFIIGFILFCISHQIPENENTPPPLVKYCWYMFYGGALIALIGLIILSLIQFSTGLIYKSNFDLLICCCIGGFLGLVLGTILRFRKHIKLRKK